MGTTLGPLGIPIAKRVEAAPPQPPSFIKWFKKIPELWKRIFSEE